MKRTYYFIVTGYNVEPYIEKCIDSILGQDFDGSRYAIVVCLDGCSDDSAMKIDFFRVNAIFNTSNMGAAYSRAECINLLNHTCNDDDVIITVDADDYLAHDQVLNRLEKEYDNDADRDWETSLYTLRENKPRPYC